MQTALWDRGRHWARVAALQVICGDYFVAELQNPTAAAKGTGNPLEYFHHLSNDVFLPLLHSAGIVGEWPETMQKEVLVNLHDMTGAWRGGGVAEVPSPVAVCGGSQSGPHRCCYCRLCCRCAIAGSVAGTMTRTIGESNGTTQLALPPDDDSPLFAKDKDGKSVMDTKDKAYQLETSITNWAAQIKDILKVRARAHFLAHGCPAGCARVRGRGRVRWRLMGWLRRAGQSGGGSQGG